MLDFLTWPFQRLETWLASLSPKQFFTMLGVFAFLGVLAVLATLLLLYLTHFSFLNWME